MKYRNKILVLYISLIAFIGFAIYINISMHDTNEKFQTQHNNILGSPIQACSTNPEKTTGYYRNGYCSTGTTDTGTHVVCAVVDDDFLNFTKSKGNDLISPQPSFPGLVSGDKWCLCALRWKEAYDAGKAPKLIPESTNEMATKYVSKDILMKYRLVLTYKSPL
jgi:uncharacterized protein (DUF2237 family)